MKYFFLLFFFLSLIFFSSEKNVLNEVSTRKDINQCGRTYQMCIKFCGFGCTQEKDFTKECRDKCKVKYDECILRFKKIKINNVII